MTVWNFLDKLIAFYCAIAPTALGFGAGVLFLVGFGKHGMNFLKYGFKQSALDASLNQRFSDMDARQSALNESLDRRFEALEQSISGLRTEMRTEISGLRTEMRTEISGIKVNHFGHLKNYLSVLDGILLDKNIISNQDRARLDNELRNM